MATVFLAFDPNVEREVALKLLPREFLYHESFRERFSREAKIIASLDHPNIVPIFDFGEVEGQPFFVMRYLTGGTLSDQLKAGPFGLREAANLVEKIGSALDYAHQKGVIHRDLKPANILFDQFETPNLADFGIARIQETGATLTGSVFMGTPSYMSPEQVHGNRKLDGRSDIYALGVILFEALTGKRPYKADTAASLAIKHITEPVPEIREVMPSLPPGTETVIHRTMAKEPEHRYANAAELTDHLKRLASGQTLQAARPVSRAARQRPSPTRPAPTLPDAVPSGPPVRPVAKRPSAPGPVSPRRRFPAWAMGAIALAVVVFIAAAVVLGSAAGLFGSDPTNTPTVEPTEELREEPSATPPLASTAGILDVERPDKTATPSATDPSLAPTLKSTLTSTPSGDDAALATPTTTPSSTATRAGGQLTLTATQPPVNTLPPPPTNTPSSQPTATNTSSPPTNTPKPTNTPLPQATRTNTPPPTKTLNPTTTPRPSATPDK
jgi:serine/threonine protein kinase